MLICSNFYLHNLTKIIKMCGIFCYLNAKGKLDEPDCQEFYETYFKERLSHRGPNACHNLFHEQIYFSGHVLWQQGANACQQPVTNGEDVFLFNGDIFMQRNDSDESDTEWLFHRLKNCIATSDFKRTFSHIRGPYSLIYYKKSENTIFFIRDSLGRNSLLIGRNNKKLFLSSVGNATLLNYAVIELPPLGLYELNLNTISIKLTPWSAEIDKHKIYVEQLESIKSLFENNFSFNIASESIRPLWLNVDEKINERLSYTFDEIIEKVENLPYDKIFDYLLQNPNVLIACNKIIQILSQSVKERIENTPQICKKCLINSSSDCKHPKVGILFSGGIDCSIIAILADKFIPENVAIDLLNVSFEKVRKNCATKNKPHLPDASKDVNWNVPDRISATEALSELKNICPKRKWNIFEINVSREELNLKLSTEIVNLIYPLVSVLDESLGGALWFAARGIGIKNGVSVKASPCRVLLIGSGADELFGGYTRHKNAFKRQGGENNPTLEEELLLDWLRLPSRNLARDDRVICDHGVTLRAPFVQEDLTYFVRNLKPLQKCYHALEQGIGDKLLLRLCGYRLGLQTTACRKKKALQFGSRIADSRQNAKDQSLHLI